MCPKDVGDVWYVTRIPALFVNVCGRIKDVRRQFKTHGSGRAACGKVHYQGAVLYAHYLIFSAFHPAVVWPLGPGISVDHADGNRENIEPHNLRLANGRMLALNQTRGDRRGLQPARVVAEPAAVPPGAPDEPVTLDFADVHAAGLAFGLSADDIAKAVHWEYAMQHPESRLVYYLAYDALEGDEFGGWAAVAAVSGLEVAYRARLRQWMGTCYQELLPGTHNGYHAVWCTIDAVSRALYLRDLVAAAFVPLPDAGGPWVLCNRDGDRLNDAADNLEWRLQ